MHASPLIYRRQIETILLGWGARIEAAAATADVLLYAGLSGIDSHGISMLTEYDSRRRNGWLDLKAKPRVISETPASVLIDGGGGLGHWPGSLAMSEAIARAKTVGLAAASVRNSAHFGACGYYTKMAAEAGLIGIATTSAMMIRVAPTFGAEAKLGTDPFSFAAPGEEGKPFLLDMATTTVAFGKVRNRHNETLPCPPGWILDSAGRPSTDPADVVERGGLLTPLGGSAENASYKGYGLAAMVNILSACLAGAALITDPARATRPGGPEIGHFFLALDPKLFRDPAEFRADVAAFCDSLRATRPLDPATPVLVAGDPERAAAERRAKEGIPIPPGLAARLQEIAREVDVPWLL
ncbi:MAG TPA: Ldh family oxidoreductase [Acetobacteraceae bacterium]|jgi:LDH2 family malate/lactate/ureidoglycolate dehydrogenase|nr:Ldh family oxidoreductase [Acetobacteraceae bacterium]